MYVGGGLLVTILVILLIIYLADPGMCMSFVRNRHGSIVPAVG